MDIFIYQLLTVAGIHALAVISPGPDFLLVSKYSLSASKKIAVIASLGIACGIAVHTCLALFGIALLISESHFLYVSMQYFGALYLAFIGYSSLRSSVSKKEGIETVEEKINISISLKQAFISGFMTNVLNPKAILFFLAIFTQVIGEKTSIIIKALYGLEMTIATFCWFTLVATVFSSKRIRTRILSYQKQIDMIFGFALILMAIFVAFK